MNENQTRRILAERSHGCCERCGVNGTTVHHRKKRGQGGPWTPSNCVALCGHGTTGCHGWVESHPNDAWNEGWHVRPWEDELDRPVLRRGDWVLLNNNGEVEWEDLERGVS